MRFALSFNFLLISAEEAFSAFSNEFLSYSFECFITEIRIVIKFTFLPHAFRSDKVYVLLRRENQI